MLNCNKKTINNGNPITPAVFACGGLSLSDEERAVFIKHNPQGFILFSRNVDTRNQLRCLVKSLKECVSHANPLILIDQEGGQVARLGSPNWRTYCNNIDIGEILAKEDLKAAKRLAFLKGYLIGHDLAEVDINVNCAPVIDLLHPTTAAFLRKRTFGSSVENVITLSKEFSRGLRSQGIVPIIKHLPGHGRATQDTHHGPAVVDVDLPTLEKTDFAIMKAMGEEFSFGMVAHVVYTALDAQNPGSVSQNVADYIKNSHILTVISDAIEMNALAGSLPERAKQVIAAGYNFALYGQAVMTNVEDIAGALPPTSPDVEGRVAAILEYTKTQIDRSPPIDQATAEYEELCNRIPSRI